jgi:hypothetical protein
MSLGGNTLHPLQIEDARDAAYEASKRQREVEDQIREASKDLAEKERLYREALSLEIVNLHAAEVAWTTCEAIARGKPHVSRLRYERDVARGVLDAAVQQAYRRGADRKDVHRLLRWSEQIDLRVDTPPTEFSSATGQRPRAVA